MGSNQHFVASHDDSRLRASKRLFGLVGMGQDPLTDHHLSGDDLPAIGISLPPDVIGSDGYGERQRSVSTRRRGDRHHISTLLNRFRIRTSTPADQRQCEYPTPPGSAYR